jgi:2-haloacid dehalogenase
VAAHVLVFDVNETLLDVRAMEPGFAEQVGDGALLAPWFSLMVRNSMVAALTDSYAPFPEQGVAALVTVAAAAGIDVDETTARTVVSLMETLPAHPDVAPALGRLSDAGFRLGTLTNSPSAVAERQLSNAGIAGFFEERLSVDAVRTFKPAPAPYRHAAERFAVPIAAMRMIAAHDWDVTGAMRAGAAGAFVARRGASLGPLSEIPDVIGDDLLAVADQLIAAEAGA